MTRVDLIYFNTGGGHRASALALVVSLIPNVNLALCESL
jgi:hypothetical protein